LTDIAVEFESWVLVSMAVPLVAEVDCSLVRAVEESTERPPVGASPKNPIDADVPNEFVCAVDDPLVYCCDMLVLLPDAEFSAVLTEVFSVRGK
jgi:hypothetical protein